MKTAKRALSALMVLAMLMSCMGATTFTAGDEQQPDGNAQVIEVSPSVGEPQVSEPASEPQTSEPAGEPQVSEPAGEPQESEPADAPQESEPAGEPQASEPANEPQVSESAGESEPAPKASTMSLGNPSPISAPAPIANGDPVTGTIEQKENVTWTYGESVPTAEVAKSKFDFKLEGDNDSEYNTEPVLTFADTEGGPFNATEPPKDAGVHYVQATWKKTVGSPVGDITAEASFTIAQAELTVTTKIKDTQDKLEEEYTGTAFTVAPESLNCKVVLGEAQNGEEVTAEAVLKSKDGLTEYKDGVTEIGEYVVGYKITYGSDVKPTNYAPTESQIATFTIKPRTLTINIGTQTVDYTGSNIVLTSWQKSDHLDGDNLKSVTVEAAGVGSYTGGTLIAETIDITDANGKDVKSHYAPIVLTGTLTIKKADASAYTPSVTMADWTYGDNAADPKPSVAGPGSADYAAPTITYAVSGTENFVEAKPVNAGDYTVKAVWAATDNLPELKATDDFTIAARKITVEAKVIEQYAGKPITVELTEKNITSSGDLASGDKIASLKATVTGETVEDGPYTFNKEQSKAEIVINNANDDPVTDNYDITFVGTLNIELAAEDAYTGTVALEGWTYDGTAYAPSAVIDPSTAAAEIIAKYGKPVYHYYAANAEGKQGDEVQAPPVDAGTYFVQAVWNEDEANESLRVLKSNVLEYEIEKRPITLQSASDEKDYDGKPLEKNEQTDVEPIENTSFVTGESFVYDFTGSTITNVAENKAENNEFTVSAGPNTKLENYEIKYVFGTLEITPREVTVTAEGTKQFGATDPDMAILVNKPIETDPTGKSKSLQVAFADVVEGEEELFLKAFDIKAERDPGEVEGLEELPGAYDIKVTVEPVQDDTYAENYTVTVASPYEEAFEITKVPAFNVVLGDKDSATDITSHTVGQVKYEIKANDGQELIDNLKTYVDITLTVNADEVRDGAHAVPEPKVDPEADPEQSEPVTPNIPKSIDRDETTEDKAGTFTIPAVSYNCDGYTWSSGLPAGTVLTAVVASKNETGAKADSTGNEEVIKVAPVSGSFVITVAAGANDKYVYPDSLATDVILDGAGTITVLPEAPDAENVGRDDWVVLTVGGKVYHYNVDHYEELNGIAVPAEDRSLTLNLAQLSALSGIPGEDVWFGGNPQSKLAVTARLLDTVNHTPAEAGGRNVAFDTGAVNSTQNLGNREDASESIALEIKDSVSEKEPSAATTGMYGGSTPVFTAVSGMSGTITWNNVTEWKDTPDTLPHSGDSFTVQYRDLVGNPVTHTVNVVRSDAVTSNTLYVQPITSNTVPGKALTFFGDTNVWEAGVLTIGGRTYNIEPLAGGATYDNSAKRWQYIVTLGDINFPVGVPTTVSMAYEDLNGGEASIVITYKDQAQTPVLGSEPVAGSQTLWGYVESSASVSVSIYHADGSITQVPQDNIAVDQFGYFYVRLGSPLAEGEQVSISTRDFCDNQKFITVNVQKELEPNAAAEVLGANIVDELENTDDIYHRFATPIDLGALAQAENKSMTLPILAYKGIEIGEITFTLNDQGELNVTYTIKSTSFVPDGAKARMATFTSKPTIDQLVRGEMPVVVSDLKTAATGTIPAVDVTAYQADDGSYSGVIWLQAAFDIDMTEDNYISRGGRGASFYRWLTEALQTESVLGAVYKETSAYASNVRYYDLYQTFENISRMS